ncbi:MAG: family tricarboxylate transporter, receptor protein [Hyphomicrobiales bacterium]|nr:family tricarboxylate transporter, receptor protein [Hyphomicrobiales bacterium]
MGKRPRSTAAAAGLALLGLFASGAARAADFDLKDRTVTIYVAGGLGGGVDAYARAIAPYFQKYLPGHPAVVIANMPGAGGAQAVQYLYNVAPKDGAAIGTTNVGPIADPFLEKTPSIYDVSKFGWLGSLATGNTVCAVWHTVDVNSIEDVKSKVVTVAATGARSAPTRSALLMNALIGTKFKPISGYTGGTALLALERGEVDATCTTLNSLRATRPHWIRDGKLKILVHVAMEADAEFPKVPRALDFVHDKKDRDALEFFLLPYEFNNPYYLPPGTRPEVLAGWRAAFDKAAADPDYLAEAKKRLQDVDVKSGAQVEALVGKLFAAPADVIKRTVEAIDPTGKVVEAPETK